jgi:hypothetical protein
MIAQAADDELVYPASSRAVPSLRFTRHLAAEASLRFHGLLARYDVDLLLDSGAAHSCVSALYLHSNHNQSCSSLFKFVTNLWPSHATLADGSSVNVVGILWNVEVRIGSFCVMHEFLLVEMDV